MTKQYDDIRDLLASNKLMGLSGQGATDEDISFAERKMGVNFPISFRSFLKEHGWGYFGSLELISGLGTDIPKEWESGTNLLQVVDDERLGPSHFPHDIIPFCQNGAGDWYALDCSRSDRKEATVVFVAHENVAGNGFNSEFCAMSFADWIYEKLSGNALA